MNSLRLAWLLVAFVWIPVAITPLFRGLRTAWMAAMTAPLVVLWLISYDLYLGSSAIESAVASVRSAFWLLPLILWPRLVVSAFAASAGPIRLFAAHACLSVVLGLFGVSPFYSALSALTTLAAIVVLAALVRRRGPAGSIELLTAALLLWCTLALVIELIGALGLLQLRFSPPLLPGVRRALAISLHQNSLGACGATLVLLGWACHEQSGVSAQMRRVAPLAILIGALTVVASGQRTSLIALALCVAVVFLMRLGRIGRIASIAGIAALVAIVVVSGPPGGNWVSTRPGVAATNSLAQREAIWNLSTDLVAGRPMFGYGTAASRTVLADAVEQATGIDGIIHAHNLVLQSMLDGGLVGTVMLFVAFAVTTVAASRTIMRRSRSLTALLLFTPIAGLSESTLGIRQPYVSTLVFFAIVCVVGLESRQLAAPRHAPSSSVRLLVPAR